MVGIPILCPLTTPGFEFYAPIRLSELLKPICQEFIDIDLKVGEFKANAIFDYLGVERALN